MSALRQRSDWLVFLALGAMWGSSYLFIKIGIETVTPLTLVALRLGVGTLLLAGVVALAGERLPRGPRTYLHLTVMAVLNIVVPFSLITWAELSMASSLAAILTAAVPLFAVIIAASVLRDEPVTPMGVAGLGVGFVGVIVLTGPAAFSSGGSALAVLALLGAAASYACATVYARRNLAAMRPTVPAFLQVAIAFVLSGALALSLEAPLAMELTGPAVLSVLWLGLLGSGVAYLAYFRLIRSWGATRTAAVAYILPVVGISLGALVADETIDLRVVAGTALIVGGVALLNTRLPRRQRLGPPARIEVEAAR
jgi:drug/metabolite transporter (DMT)-like permease